MQGGGKGLGEMVGREREDREGKRKLEEKWGYGESGEKGCRKERKEGGMLEFPLKSLK